MDSSSIFKGKKKEKKKKNILRQKGGTEENEINSFYNNIDNSRNHQHIKFLINL